MKFSVFSVISSVFGDSGESTWPPPSQGSFTETITENFSKINRNDTEIYILSDFNINLFSNQKYILHQTNTKSMSHEVKNYFQFCSWYGLEQLIKCNGTRTYNHLVRKRTLNHLAKLTK